MFKPRSLGSLTSLFLLIYLVFSSPASRMLAQEFALENAPPVDDRIGGTVKRARERPLRGEYGGAAPGALQETEEPPTLLGLYPWGGLQESVIQIQAMDEWAGVGNSIAATFMDLYDPLTPTTLAAELSAAWSAGYTPFINLAPSPGTSGEGCPAELTAEAIAGGSLDVLIRAWATAFRDWADADPARRAFIAPLQEMNGYWICYGLDPEGFRRAFAHMQRVFKDVGVAQDSVSWVFAPNGWSDEDAPPFEAYYPGDSLVDVVSFSAYNFAACSPFPGDDWRAPEEIFDGFLERMRAMAPGKPIFIAETATTSMRQDGTPGGKDEWLKAAYAYLDASPALRGVLYFNVDEHPTYPDVPDCDFPIYKPPEVMGFEGYRESVNDSAASYTYVAPGDIGTLAFQPPEGVFEDVWPVHPLAGVDETNWARAWIEALAVSGITAGCRVEQLLPGRDGYPAVEHRYYCPQSTVTRAQMAVFLERGMRGVDATIPSPEGDVFEDVSTSHWATPWIEQLAEDGITGGCSAEPPMYCPESPVTRAQMAIFLERAMHWGEGFSPGEPMGSEFDDVPRDHWAAAWIEQLAADGITGGCSADPPQYCPESPVTREQMAVFLTRAFDISIP